MPSQRALQAAGCDGVDSGHMGISNALGKAQDGRVWSEARPGLGNGPKRACVGLKRLNLGPVSLALRWVGRPWDVHQKHFRPRPQDGHDFDSVRPTQRSAPPRGVCQCAGERRDQVEPDCRQAGVAGVHAEAARSSGVRNTGARGVGQVGSLCDTGEDRPAVQAGAGLATGIAAGTEKFSSTSNREALCKNAP